MQSACVQAVHQSIACSSIKSVSASYDTCIDTLHSSSCSTLFPADPDTGSIQLKLPAVCSSVLLSLAPSGPGDLSRALAPAPAPGAPAAAATSEAVDELASRAGATLVSPAE